MRAKIAKLRWLCLLLLISVLIQAMGISWVNSSVSTWYPTLEKASWNPPGWMFGPVWTLLYLLIAIAGWRIYLCPRSQMRTKALVIYWVQLGVNALWPYLFFYLQRPWLGLVDMVVLVTLLGWALYSFFHLSRAAFWIFVPYFFWVLYATTLNFAICVLMEVPHF